MIDLNIKKTAPKKQTVTPGIYTSVVKSVDWAEDYLEGHAFEIHYTLTNKSGKKFEYKEIFYNSNSNTRTRALFDYLNDHGIEDISLFVGCKETLTFLKGVRNNSTFIRIANREFLSHEDSGGET